jgi:hypothetical protein
MKLISLEATLANLLHGIAPARRSASSAHAQWTEDEAGQILQGSADADQVLSLDRFAWEDYFGQLLDRKAQTGAGFEGSQQAPLNVP